MAWDSTATASMIGMYQGMAMSNMAYSNQIGMMAAPPMYGQGAYGDRMMGGAMNMAGAIGSPMLSMGASLAPMMMGLGPLASTGVGIPLAAAASIGQYAGSQMYTGAQQQQALKQTLRSSLNFQNQYGGNGFSRSDMSMIGNQVREMTYQIGPGGQMNSFGELAQLTQKMSSMGLMQGVRDVQEFSKKFKETISALKTMAHDLGTTLDGALEFANAAKGSGIFGMSNASKFTSMARGTAVSGGLAMSEVTSMANIGSQISRSIGGLGRQGAIAGMKTIGQIGTAQQMGILSEEDIYNATGLSGAEGRQAFASSQLQHAAGFLRTGRGRRLLASMADVNGQLDASSAMMLMSGGMGIPETMAQDRARVTGAGAPVNRANFIRNEGRLRGQVLQEFGTFVPAMQLMQWAQSKGVDINNMDDRSMLFAQRQLGMGRDELDSAVKMATNMPRILAEKGSRIRRDDAMQDFANVQRGVGVEGIKNRFDQARETVNGRLQKIGQDFFNEGSEAIDSFIQRLTGMYKQKFSEEVDQAYRNSARGGRTATATLDRLTGLPSGGPNLAAAGALGLVGGGGVEAFNRGADLRGGGMMGALRSPLSYLMHGESDASRMARAGYKVSAKTNEELSRRLQEIGDTARAANEPADSRYLALGTSQAEWMKIGFANGSIAGQGDDKIASFGTAIMAHGSKAQQAAWNAAKTNAEKARIINSMSQGAGMGSQGLDFAVPEMASQFYGPGVSDTDRRKRMADAFAGGLAKKSVGGRVGGAVGGSLVGTLLGPIGILAGAAVGSNGLGYGLEKGGEEMRRSLGAFLDSDEGNRLMYGIGQKDSAESTRTEILKQMSDIRSNAGREHRDTTSEEKGKLTGLGGILAANEYDALLKSAGGDPKKISSEQLKKIGEKYGVSGDQIPKMHEGMQGIMSGKQLENLKGLALSQGAQASKRLNALAASGMASFEGGQIHLSAGSNLSPMAQRMLQATVKEAAAGEAAKSGNLVGMRDAMVAAGEMHKSITGEFAAMSVEDKRKMATSLAKEGMDSSEFFAMAAAEDRLKKTTNRRRGGGADVAVMQALGVELDDDMKKAMKGATAEQKARIISNGLGSPDKAKEIEEILGNIKAGKTGIASNALTALASDAGVQKGLHDKQENKQRQDNPLLDSMDKHLESMERHHQQQVELLKIIGRHTGNAAAEIAKLDKEDPEKPKQ